jgi:hypothetical protein
MCSENLRRPPQYFPIKKASQRGFALGEAFFYCTFAKFLIEKLKKKKATLDGMALKKCNTPESITLKSAAYQEF